MNRSFISLAIILAALCGCSTPETNPHAAVDEMLQSFTNRIAYSHSRAAAMPRDAAWDRRGPTNDVPAQRSGPYGIRLHVMPPMPPVPIHPFDVPLPFLPVVTPPDEEPPPLPDARRISPGLRIDMAVAASLFR